MLKKRFIRLSSSGFSLLETMITVTVFGVLVAVAIPSFTDYIERKRVQTEADSISNLFSEARNAALNRLTNVEVCWNSTDALNDDNDVPARSIVAAILPSDDDDPVEVLSIKEFSSTATFIADDDADNCATIDVQGRLVLNSVSNNSLVFGICKDDDGVLDDSLAITLGRSGRAIIEKNESDSGVGCS